MLLPITAIVPTRDRSAVLKRMLLGLCAQSAQPCEVIVADSSATNDSEVLCQWFTNQSSMSIKHFRSREVGAAAQRNEALSRASQAAILFLDDDIIFEQDCVSKLWLALNSDPAVGGVNATIVNQQYSSPGLVSRLLFAFMNGGPRSSYAGKCIGPAINLLPADSMDLPEIVPVDWLNTTCTLYRKSALPRPAFASHFTGYSLFEDLALSLMVGRRWELKNARTARIFHDSQPASHKSDLAAFAEMELVNRHYVMTEVLEKRNVSNYLRLVVWEVFQLGVCALRPDARRRFFRLCSGKIHGVRRLLKATRVEQPCSPYISN